MFLVNVAGGTLRLPCVSSLSARTQRPSSSLVTLGGVRRMHLAPRTLREVPISWGVLSPVEWAPLVDLLSGAYGIGPWRFVTDWAATSNALAPRVAACVDAPARTVAGGPATLDDGTPVGASLVPTGEGVVWLDTAQAIPVLPGLPVAVSAWVRGAGQLQCAFYRADGSAITTLTRAVDGGAGLSRVGAAFTAPAGAVAITMGISGVTRIARPAVTLTDAVVDYGPGEGIRGVITGTDMATIWAVPGQAMAEGSATIVEVGA